MNQSQQSRDKETASYLTFVQRLADEFQIAIEHVLPLYEQELKNLRKSARVTSYLPILTVKHVRDALQVKIRDREQ